MESTTPRPIPAPPKNRVAEQPEISALRNKISKKDDAKGYRETFAVIDEVYVFNSGQAESMPPINLKSPDGKRVIEVRAVEKAKSMAAKGWTITNEKKTPFVPPEHLTNQPFREGLADLKRQMDKIEKSRTYGKKPPAKRRPFKKNVNKENN